MQRLAVTVWCAALIACPAALGSSTPSSPLGFAVSAVGFQSYFVFDTRPGRIVHGTLRVVNLVSEPRTIQVAPVDVSTASAGGLQYGNESPRREGRWLELAARTVRLAGYGSTNVLFAVRVPSGARPGDHFMGVVAVDRRVLNQKVGGSGPIRLRLIPRLAMTIQVRLPGHLTSEMAVGRVSIAVAPSGASLALQISNPANTLIRSTTGNVTISQGSMTLFSQGIELASFVPKTVITYHVPWEGTPVEGTYRVSGELRPTGARPIQFDRTVTFGLSAIHQYRRQTGRQATERSATPILLIAALALAVGIAAAFGVSYTHARKQLRDR